MFNITFFSGAQINHYEVNRTNQGFKINVDNMVSRLSIPLKLSYQ